MIPVIMRGSFYSTPFTARCSAFHECSVCHGCTVYNPMELACSMCESGHKKELICNHTDKQRESMRLITKTIGPMFDLNAKAGSVSIANLDEHKEVMEIADSMDLSKLR